MSSGSKQTGTTTTMTNTAPWGGQAPYLKTGFQRAKTDILNKPQEFYPNSTVVPFSGQTEQALQMQEQRALQGSPVTQAAQQQALSTIQGDYLNANPYLNQVIGSAVRPIAENFSESILPGIQGGFSSRGRYGSGLQAFQQQRAGEGAMREMGDVAGRLAYGNYADERARQLAALQTAPGLAAQDYQDIAQLGQVGRVREGQAGAELQEQIDRFNLQQQAPKDALSQYMALVGGGSYGGSAATSQPIYSNPTAEKLGMLGSAASIGNMFGLWG